MSGKWLDGGQYMIHQKSHKITYTSGQTAPLVDFQVKNIRVESKTAKSSLIDLSAPSMVATVGCKQRSVKALTE